MTPKTLRTIPRNERGSILILSTVGVVLSLILSSLAVDMGFLAHEIRVDQKVADLAALDASRKLPATTADLTAAAQASALRNGFPTDPGYSVTAIEGVKIVNAGSDVCQAQPGQGTVCVTATSLHTNFFPFVDGGQSKSRVAVAGTRPEASFSVGSTLASVDTQKSFLDPILGSMLGPVAGPALSMGAVGYNGLVGGSVSLQALQSRLVSAYPSVGTTAGLLTTSVKVSDLLTAAAQVLTAQGNSAAAAQLNNIPIASIPNTKTVSLGKLVNLSQPGNNSALSTTLNVFQLVTGAAEVANGSNFVSVPGLVITPPAGVASVSIALRAIEPAQSVRGPVGPATTAKTSQVVLQVTLNLLPILGNAVTAVVDFTAGNGSVTLIDIACTGSPSITVSAATSAAAIVETLTVALVGSITVPGTVAAAAPGPVPSFLYPSQFAPPVGPSPAFSRHVGVANMGLTPTTLGPATASGLLGTVAGIAQPIVVAALGTLDSALVPTLGPILKVLGLDLAGADITALGIHDPPPKCGVPTLVQ